MQKSQLILTDYFMILILIIHLITLGLTLTYLNMMGHNGYENNPIMKAVFNVSSNLPYFKLIFIGLAYGVIGSTYLFIRKIYLNSTIDSIEKVHATWALSFVVLFMLSFVTVDFINDVAVWLYYLTG